MLGPRGRPLKLWSSRVTPEAGDAVVTLHRVARPDVARFDSKDQLARMTPAFKRALSSEFDVGGLLNKLCPVELENGTVALFCVEQYAHSEQIEEFERMVDQRGRTLARPGRVVVPATLLLSIVRGQITGDMLRSRRRVLLDPVKSSMLQRFTTSLPGG